MHRSLAGAATALLVLLLAACAPMGPASLVATGSATPATAGAAGPAATTSAPALPAATARAGATLAVATAPAPEAANLGLLDLKSATYPSEVVPEGQAKLTNGSYEAPAAAGSAISITVRLIDQWVAYGDLNGDGAADAAVILAESGGGSGTFFRLAAVLNAGGRPGEIVALTLGDRVKINSVAIRGGEISVALITHGPKDPACCPSLATTQKYRLVAGKLVETTPPTPAAPTATVAPTAATFSDPFAYCAAAGSIDAPDSRYVGPKVPSAVAAGLMQAMNLPASTPPPPIAENSFWRCMDGKVYACTVGANLPCSEKANTDRTPTQDMKDYCQANPKSDFIPAVVTGRATVYSWQCNNGAPEVKEQASQVDARGFLANIWYEIKP